VALAIGSPGGRTIINTVLEVVVAFVDFGMNVQEAIDAPRFHHQWLPDRIHVERYGLSPDTIALLRARGHEVKVGEEDDATQGVAEGVAYDAAADMLEGGFDRRAPTERPSGADWGSSRRPSPRGRGPLYWNFRSMRRFQR
jgi:gamma-glutamyltranspeptidase/glutathione hydrolase